MKLGSKVIVGNWKMYKTVTEAIAFVDALLPKISNYKESVLLAVPFTALWPLHEKCKNTPLEIGAQTMNSAEEGAFTGEIAGRMLKEAGASFVLLGHSERRRLSGETDSVIHKKVERALEDNLLPIVCVGETLEERKEGRSEEVLERQLKSVFEGLKWKGDLLVAYEPVWAIGTGQTATPDIIDNIHAFIEEKVEALLGVKPRILYGGSANSANAPTLLAIPNVGGLLIGGASLDLESFLSIIENSHSFQ
jgi:triosephosphate isomerase